MNPRIYNSSLIFLFFGSTILCQSNPTGTLEIKFTELRNDVGNVAIGINTSSEGWPREPQIELQWKKGEIVNGEFTVRVPELPYGTLAISALDDLDGNREMDMVLGIPREGFGFSMDPPFKLSAPKFKDCSFLMNQPNQQITIRFRYTGKGK